MGIGPEDAVDVDGVVGVFRVPAGEVLGVAGQEVVHPVGVADEKLIAGSLAGGLFALLGVEDVAFAVVQAVFADAGIGIGLVVHRAVEAEFDVFGAPALRFDLRGVGFGSAAWQEPAASASSGRQSKPRWSSSLAAERRWQGLKSGSSPSMAETRKRPSRVSWAMMSARVDIYSILGRTAGGVKGGCHVCVPRLEK